MISKIFKFLFFYLAVLIIDVKSQVVKVKLISYGANANDSKFSDNDKFVGPLNISASFPFFNVSYESLWINTNGLVSFNGNFSEIESTKFPNDFSSCVSPFWSNIDLKNAGKIFYREITDKITLQIVENDVIDKFYIFYDFSAIWAFVVTWVNVTQLNGNNLGNTFQVVLTTNGSVSFAIFNYESLSWSSGTSQAGLNAGDGIHFYNLPGSYSNSIKNLTNLSNVGLPGKWIYRTDSLTNFDYGCTSDNLMRFKPSNVSVLGGQSVDITGPCFNHDDLVIAIVDSDQENPLDCVFKDKYTCTIKTSKFKGSGKIPVLLIINYYLLYEKDIHVYDENNNNNIAFRNKGNQHIIFLFLIFIFKKFVIF